MKSEEKVRKGSTNLVLKSFPQEKKVMSDIAIIDLRSCIRDAMAAAIRSNSDRRIFTADNSVTLSHTSFCSNPSPRQTILFCDGSLDIESVSQELEDLRAYQPDAKIALLTDRYTDHLIADTFAKLDGIIPSYYQTEQLLACIQVIESGIKYLPASAQLARSTGAKTSREKHTTDIDQEAGNLLTPRQKQVMLFITEGRSNKYIAAELSVSESTIKVHVHEAMKRLGATSRTHAAFIMSHNSQI